MMSASWKRFILGEGRFQNEVCAVAMKIDVVIAWKVQC